MNRSMPRRLPLLLALAAAIGPGAALAQNFRCADDSADLRPGHVEPVVADTASPRATLAGLVRDAMARSQALGAARLLAEAAAIDIDEARSAALPQAALSGQVGPAAARDGGATTKGLQGRVSLSVSAPLYDGGRIQRLTNWRTQLAEAARLGQLSAQEQVSLQTVSLALERARFRLQAKVYQQYSVKMSCLVEALETIVAADKGRTSELVQARKTRQQADLSYTQTISAVRQIELRLRRFVGDALPPTDGLASVLVETPPLDQLLAMAERTSDIAALAAQADAADAYASAVDAARSPQVGWTVGGAKTGGAGSSTTGFSAGVTVNIPLMNPGVQYAAESARKRAQAARLQRADALEAKQSRMAEIHEQANSALDRARRVMDVLRNSEQVRNFTLQQWQQLGRRSLFDVMASEGEHYQLRAMHVNAIFDMQQANALLWSLGVGVAAPLQ